MKRGLLSSKRGGRGASYPSIHYGLEWDWFGSPAGELTTKVGWRVKEKKKWG